MKSPSEYEFETLREFGDSALGYHAVHYSEEDPMKGWGEGEAEYWNSARLYLQQWAEDGELQQADYSDFDNLVIDDLTAKNAAAGCAYATEFKISDDPQLGQILNLRDTFGIGSEDEFHFASEEDGTYFRDINTPADDALAIERSLNEGKEVYMPESISYLPNNASDQTETLLDEDCRKKIGAQFFTDLVRNADHIENYPGSVTELEGDTVVLVSDKTRHHDVQMGDSSGTVRAFPGRVISSILE